MQWRAPESDSSNRPIRYSLLGLIFCVLNAVELVHAKFALLTLSELHAYWLGRDGQFPFTALPWSERHFGEDALAMRLPLLVVFAVLLAVVLMGLNRMTGKSGPVMLIGGTLLLLTVLAVQQYFSLRDIRRERREFFTLLNRVERATAPGEAVVAEWNLAMPLYAYGSYSLRQELRSTLHSFSDNPPVPAFRIAAPVEETIYVGSKNDYFAQQLSVSGYCFHEYESAQSDTSELIAHYYHVRNTGIYFVSHPAASSPATTGSAAVSSKP